ncbi:hypothetical protein C8R43DRAFT_910356, partial [Mycena crocata]
YQQVAPKLYAEQANLIARLHELRGLQPRYPNSVFTTIEVAFCDVPNLSRKNFDAIFYGMEVFTVRGDSAWEKRGGIIMWDDGKYIPLRPGTTVIFPVGTKRFSFVPVAPHETRFIFRQYGHAGVMRWVEKGGRSDMQFNKKVSAEEKALWEAKHVIRGQSAAKLYSHLKDVYVV